MQKSVNGVLVDMTPEEVAALDLEQTSYGPILESPKSIRRKDLLLKLTNMQIEDLEGEINAADAYDRQLYYASTDLVEGDEAFIFVQGILAGMVGSEEADHLLGLT